MYLKALRSGHDDVGLDSLKFSTFFFELRKPLHAGQSFFQTVRCMWKAQSVTLTNTCFLYILFLKININDANFLHPLKWIFKVLSFKLDNVKWSYL